MKVIGIVGSRSRDSLQDFQKCMRAFEKIYNDGDTVVSGGCPKGGDRFAELIARNYQISITIHHAHWEKYGKPAGPIRNTLIARDCNVLIALPSEGREGGTEDTISKVEKLGKKVILV